MASKNITLNTLDELVTFATTNHTTTRWQMWDRSDFIFDDLEAGNAWSEKWAEANALYYTDREAYEREIKLVSAVRPAQHLQTLYGLTEAGDGWHKTHITLSPELGKMIDDVWTKTKSRWGSEMDRVGILTLTGVLKRLGKTDVKELIAARENAVLLQNAKNSRNYHRSHARDAAKQALAHLEVLCLDGNMTLVEILALVDEV